MDPKRHVAGDDSARDQAVALADDEGRALHLAEMLKGLAHPLRLRIISALCESPMNVTELHTRLGVKQNLVSQHLSTLRLLGLVRVERVGSVGNYMLREEQLRDLLGCLSHCKGSL